MSNLHEGLEEFIPGTVHLVDLEGTLKAKHAKSGRGDVVLVPAPSSDPNDPLNWAPRRKLIHCISLMVYTLVVGIASAAIYSVIVPISDATGLTVATLNEGTGYMFLLFGWGCLLGNSLALQFGKRPMYIFSMLATMAIMIWTPYVSSRGEYIANKLLQGLVGAPIEALIEVSITDTYFTHERGFYMALYGLFLAGSNFFAPVISGFINDGQGWQWVFYWCAIFCGVGALWCIFFLEESNYSRHTLAGHEPPKSSGTNTPMQEIPVIDSEKGPAPVSESATGVADLVSAPAQPKPYAQRLRLFSPDVFSKPIQLHRMMIRPLIFLSFPIIAYSGFSYGSNLVWFNVLNGTASLVLGGQYHFSSSMVGLSYLGPLIGVFLGAAYTGPFGDRYLLWMTRRKGGLWEAEYRLWLFLASLVIIPWGLIQWGVGVGKIHWFGEIFAMMLIALSNTIGLQISVSYAIDSYRELAGESMITVIIIRNTMSFAVNYGLTPWVTNMGYQNAFIVAACAGVVQVLTFLIFVKWGKSWRKASTPRYLKYVKEMSEVGLVH